MTEGRKDGKTDRLKTVYPPKLRLRGVTTFAGGIMIYNFCQFSIQTQVVGTHKQHF